MYRLAERTTQSDRYLQNSDNMNVCFSELFKEGMRVVGVASRNLLYPTECIFELSAVYGSVTR